MNRNTLDTAVNDTDRADIKKIGGLIRAHRYAADLSQVEFASRLGKTQATVSEYELGSITPPLDILLQMAQIFSRALGRPITLFDLTQLDALKNAEAKLPKISDKMWELAVLLDKLPDDDAGKKAILELARILSESRDTGGDPKGTDQANQE